MPKVYFATASKEVEFERVCSNCNKRWTARGVASSGSHMEHTSEQASKTATLVLNEEMKDWRDNRDVLCPDCSHFSTDAMDIHFRKGYRAAILKNYQRASWCDFLIFVSLGWVPTLLFVFTTLNPWQAEYPARSIVFLVLFLWFGGMAAAGLVVFVWARVALPSVRRKLDALSDKELHDLAVECYKGNKNSLRVDIDMDTGFFNAWLKKPLKYKLDKGAAAEVAPG